MLSLYVATNERVSKETKEQARKQKNCCLICKFVNLLSSGKLKVIMIVAELPNANKMLVSKVKIW
jgi:hypothetical protein